MLNELIQIIACRAEDAGFREAATQQYISIENRNWPDGVLENELGYWESSFASILMVNVTTDTAAKALTLSKLAETFLDSAIVQREHSGLVIDGYLVLATTHVNDELKAFILDIERDIRFVRKHVVTWGENGWERYERITPLGLARLDLQEEPAVFTPDDSDYSGLLELLAQMGSEELAEHHGKEWNLNE
jgi:hypothetical protein